MQFILQQCSWLATTNNIPCCLYRFAVSPEGSFWHMRVLCNNNTYLLFYCFPPVDSVLWTSDDCSPLKIVAAACISSLVHTYGVSAHCYRNALSNRCCSLHSEPITSPSSIHTNVLAGLTAAGTKASSEVQHGHCVHTEAVNPFMIH